MTRPAQPNPMTATAAEILDYCDAVGREPQEVEIAGNRYAREAGALSAFIDMLCRERDYLAVKVRRMQEENA